jgi:hypothetical protein
MPPKRRSAVTPIKDPTLFEMGKLEEAGPLANLLNLTRPYDEPGLLLGCFTAAGHGPATVKMGKEVGFSGQLGTFCTPELQTKEEYISETKNA